METLVAISAHVRYEIEMWCSVRDVLGDHLWRDVEGDYLKRTSMNALIESFTIHTRALIDFLYTESPRKSDVVVTDFFTPDEWQAMLTAPEPEPPWSTAVPRNVRSQAHSPVLRDARARTNKEIAHLTYDRLRRRGPNEKLWPTADIVEALATDLFRFVDQVPAERVVDGFRTIALSIGGAPVETHKARTEPGALPPGAVATTALPPTRER